MSFRVVKSLAGWCGVVLCMAATSLLVASPAGAVAGYGDVADGRYFTEPVQWSVDNDVTGIDGNCFRPDAPVSRGEAAVYIWNMEGQPSAPAHSFVDVTVESQDAAVSWMSHNEITTGTSPTTFGPDTALTRAHLVTFLWRLAGEPAAPAHPFVDVHASWQQGSVSWAADREITTGTTETTFDPDATLTRAHLVTFLWRYQGKPEVMVDPASPDCETFQTVSAGWSHSCGVRTDNTITCWGDNRYGEADAPAGAFQTVSAGGGHSCGLRADNTLSCWGNNHFGEADAPAGAFQTVSAGQSHSCGLRADNTITCWGANYDGEADAPAGAFQTVSAGGGHSCGLRADNTLSCWGNNRSGQADAPSGAFKIVSAGGLYSCGLRADNTIICWGDNSTGAADAPGGAFQTVSADWSHSCGLRADDTVACWGRYNYSGQVDAPSGVFQTVSAGSNHSCGLRADDTVTCWGDPFGPHWGEGG